MRPIPKMLLLLALLIFGAAVFFVVLNDEDTGGVPGTPSQASTQTPAQAPGPAGR